ncbi:hypothetical protein [Parafrankia sp. FMc2]|uniref:hypothetical protein n=1 Tax=Parafrankia sp. FMc2 TaxID=3233196 RepID=UPI0034D62D5C
MTVTFLMIARIPEGGLGAFDAYEKSVLPLLACHGGWLDRRVRSVDGRTEVHLISFESRDGFLAYRDDPRRRAAAPDFAASGVQTELLDVVDLLKDGSDGADSG